MARLCAYHLCGQRFTPEIRCDQRYCSTACYDNAKHWRWRNRKPARVVAQKRRHRRRQQRGSIKRWYAARRQAGSLKALLARAEQLHELHLGTAGNLTQAE